MRPVEILQVSGGLLDSRRGRSVRLCRMTQYLLIGAGGFLGANCRYVLGGVILGWLGTGFPYATLIVNVSGSLAIGALLTLLTERLAADPAWRLLLVVGFLGGYTTFSSYSFEALALLQEGLWGRTLAYVLGSNLLSLAGCAVGVVVARVVAH
jgi:CrcB protein